MFSYETIVRFIFLKIIFIGNKKPRPYGQGFSIIYTKKVLLAVFNFIKFIAKHKDNCITNNWHIVSLSYVMVSNLAHYEREYRTTNNTHSNE